MGQQASVALGPCVVRSKHGEERQRLAACLARAEALISDPEKLELECDFHFRRAGLDAHGDLRRVELRRLLWTFAHGLGSTELTWEAIEAAAVVGTLEPQVPVVTRAEFFRCVLKTVHLVDAELRRKIAEVEEAQRQRAARASAPAAPGHAASRPRADSQHSAPEHHGEAGGGGGSCSASSSRSSSLASSSRASAEASPRGAAAEGVEDRSSGQRVAEIPQEPVPLPLFSPAPGGSPDEAAPVNGMTAMVLNNEGSFDPQRLFVDQGLLVLSDACQAEQSMAQRLFGADKRSAFDLSHLEIAASGEDIARTPVAALLPGYVLHGEARERLLVLSFVGDEALCLWFAAPEDLELCRDAVLAQAGAQGLREPAGS